MGEGPLGKDSMELARGWGREGRSQERGGVIEERGRSHRWEWSEEEREESGEEAESGGEGSQRAGGGAMKGRSQERGRILGRSHRGEGGVKRGGSLGRRRNHRRRIGGGKRGRGGAWKVGGVGASWVVCPRRSLSHLRPCPAPSDLALRNCLLTSDLTVRIGDYGLAHSNYKVGAALHQGGEPGGGAPAPPDAAPACPPQEDYYLTPERLWIPLRWAAPELLGELHGTFMVVDQSRESNIW